MIYIGDLLNKIKWDNKENPKDYVIVYYDRLSNKNFEVPFMSIGRDGMFFTTVVNGQQVSIPLHRIKQVKKKGLVIWER